MKLNTNRKKLLQLFISIIYFTFFISLSYAQTFNPNFHIDYENNLLTLSAQKADLKNVLMELSEKTGIYVNFPSSLNRQIKTELSRVTLCEALAQILKGTNHAIIYSGSGTNRAVVSKIFVYTKSKRSRIPARSTPHEKQIEETIRSYEKRLESINKKLSQLDKNNRIGKRYLRQVRSYEKIIENLKRRIR